MAPVTTVATRWGNQFSQVSRNNELRPVWDMALSSFKRKHRGAQAVMLEETSTDGSTGTTCIPNAVGESDIGLSTTDWEDALAVESFLRHPKLIKEKIEKLTFGTTAAQAYQMLFDLKETNYETEGEVIVLAHPTTAALGERKRKQEVRRFDELPEFVRAARSIMYNELSSRIFGTSFDERPSDVRLVQLYMSKQIPVEDLLPPMLLSRARAIYLQMLRDAASINGTAIRTSPRKVARKTQQFFRSETVSASMSAVSAATSAVSTDTLLDPVQAEAQRWAALPQEKIQNCNMGDGLVNEFDLIHSVRQEFPLHYTLFRMVSVHIAHEANSESTFSEAGGLSNASIGTNFLSMLVRINGNKSICKPSWDEILAEYKIRFGKPSEEEMQAACDDEDGGEESEADGSEPEDEL